MADGNTPASLRGKAIMMRTFANSAQYSHKKQAFLDYADQFDRLAQEMEDGGVDRTQPAAESGVLPQGGV